MPYQAEISRVNPSCFLFLIDQSGSMNDSFGADELGKKKADGVADAINKLLQNLIIKCAKEEGIRDYFYVGVIGYGAQLGPAFGGQLAGRDLVPISEVANYPLRIEQRIKKVEDGAGGLVDQMIKFPVWFEPVANGGTPMCKALNLARSILENWLSQHPNCFPPIVINITDGEATDGNPLGPAQSLKELSSIDGNVLLFNLHLSSHRSSPIVFPDSETLLPDDFARLLFNMSSQLTDYMKLLAQQEGFQVSDNSRGFAFNADLISVIRFLDIGTRTTDLR